MLSREPKVILKAVELAHYFELSILFFGNSSAVFFFITLSDSLNGVIFANVILYFRTLPFR